MAENLISPLAYIEEGAQIGEGVKIGPFSCIYSDTIIGDYECHRLYFYGHYDEY